LRRRREKIVHEEKPRDGLGEVITLNYESNRRPKRQRRPHRRAYAVAVGMLVIIGFILIFNGADGVGKRGDAMILVGMVFVAAGIALIIRTANAIA
jgi:hypothetical protein